MSQTFEYRELNAKIAAVYSLLPSCDVFDSREHRDWDSFDKLSDYEKLLLRKSEYELQINCSIDNYITQNKERIPYGIIKQFQKLHYEQRANGRRF
jgi:hypothetical protein